MAVKRFCDRCGKEIIADTDRYYVSPRNKDGNPVYRYRGLHGEFEICGTCLLKLQVWLKGDEDDEEDDEDDD